VTARAAGTAGPRTPSDWLPLAILAGIPLAASAMCWKYYVMGPAERLRDPLHAMLRPSGPLGLAFGIAGFAAFLFMWLYPLRKKFPRFAFAGSLAGWLRVHTLAGLSLPLMLAVHAGWRFSGLIGLGYLSMVVVVLSGIVGRYLYRRIPHSRSGLDLSLDDVSSERRALLTDIAVATGLEPAAVERALAVDTRSYQGLGLLKTLARMIDDDLARSRAVRALRHEWSHPRAGRPALDRETLARTLMLARREMALRQQMRMLDATRRLFGYWHVAHRPFAITALLAVVIHVIVAVVVGGVGSR
jgi:hypothetical protein